MTHKDELKQNIGILEKRINSSLMQCDPQNVAIFRQATVNNYEAFINNEISKEDLQDNNSRIRETTRKFIEMCSCMREKIP